LLTPGTVALSQACAGAGRRGGQSRRSERESEVEESLEGFSKCCDHSRENLKLKAR